MSFNVAHVLYLLFEKYPVLLPTNPNISRDERRVAHRFLNILEQAASGGIEIEEQDEVINDNVDGDYEPEKQEVYDNVLLPSHRHLKFGDRVVSRDEVQRAIEFYRQSNKGSRPLSLMSHHFRWIKTNSHLTKLRAYEKEQDDYKESRTNLLELLSQRLFEVVKDKLENGIHIHDCDLQMIARKLNREETKVENFFASSSWITSWKRSHRIVSRRITKFVTRKCLIDKDAIKKSADDFVLKTKQEIASLPPSCIFNADQCGVQKELYGARALAFLGEKDVERIVQSKSSITHSFTFLPMIFMDGTLGEKAYMVLAEPTGNFPPTRPIPNCPNLVVRAGKSHIMTKNSMTDWLKTCVFIPSAPKKLFIMIDCWAAFKDHNAIKECVPPGFDITIRNIPPHTTGMIQPLDVYFNGPWKNLIKKFTTHALTFHSDFLIAQRNNTIWMVSLLYHQISARAFKDFLKYSWMKAGYMDKDGTKFMTPSEACFGQIINQDCYIHGCSELAFIKCARCEEFICFNHFIVSLKHLCSSL